jgi:hypothetical protein
MRLQVSTGHTVCIQMTVLSRVLARVPVIAAALVVSITLAVAGRHGGMKHAWENLGVEKAMEPLFGDTRTVTHSIDAVRQHEDPYVVTSFDPWHRVYNYPPIWLGLRYFGVNSQSTIVLGTLFGLLTLGSLLMLFRPSGWFAWVVVFLAATSRAVLFAVERGNIDQVILFLFVALTLWAARKPKRLRDASNSVMIVCLTVLKIYPIAAAVMLLRGRKQLLLFCGTVIAAVVAFALTTGHRFALILHNTPTDTRISFGAYPACVALSRFHLFVSTEFMAAHPHSVTVMAAVVALLALALRMCFRRRVTPFLPRLDTESPLGLVATGCIAIYLLTFAAGSNYDYRLIFLLGPLAYLVSDARGVRLHTVPVILLFVAYLWKPYDYLARAELLDLLCFAIASAWLLGSLLDRLWMKEHRFMQASEADPESGLA